MKIFIVGTDKETDRIYNLSFKLAEKKGVDEVCVKIVDSKENVNTHKKPFYGINKKTVKTGKNEVFEIPLNS